MLLLTLVNLILVLPYSQFYFLCMDWGVSLKKSCMCSCVGLVVYLYTFWKIGEGFPTVNPSSPKKDFVSGLFAEEGAPSCDHLRCNRGTLMSTPCLVCVVLHT